MEVLFIKYEISKEQGMSDFFFSDILIVSSPGPHIHSHIEFIYVTKGNIRVMISDKEYPLGENDMAVSMPYEIHSYEYENDAEAFVLACPPEYLSEYRQLLTGKVFAPPTVSYTEVHKLLVETLIKENFENGLKKKALLYCTVSEFFNSSVLEDAPVFEYDVYRKAISYISNSYKENITLKKTALHIGVSVAHLSRVLNSNGKRGFSETLNFLRAYEARKLIERDNLPLSKVAMESGFGSIRNFNRIFKKYYGHKPNEAKK